MRIREFHISNQSRKRYEVDETLFSFTGNVIFTNYHQARVLAHRMNQKRDTLHHPGQAIRAGHIYAMGLIDEIFHFMVRLYQELQHPEAMKQALQFCETRIGVEKVEAFLRRFVQEFSPIRVYRNEQSAAAYLKEQANRVLALEELLMLWLANENPAFSPFRELFDDTRLAHGEVYHPLMQAMHRFFEDQPPFGPDRQNLIAMLRSPALHSPHSLFDQLDYIRTRWRTLIQEHDLYKLLSSLDFIREEEKAGRFFGGPGPSRVPIYQTEGEASERFSHDLDWMPNVVLMAKNVYVWMDQLSKQYERSITRLDQIPDETLDRMADWGFTGLWLIGVWERSPASKRIKQMCGNPDAEASAYALYDYVIANDLGAESAFENLKARAWHRGIRMSGDMVPNHVGIDGKWVIEHPDWFVSLPYSPFPAYTFTGADLSNDARVGIYLEDHYFNRSDAAVVFKRRDHYTGSEQYIYHGNDGTSMPWNDTAQINFLNPDAREAVIQNILHVARKFPIIRFDAAMTLAKRHVQRLWFPEPGTGGDIASRVEHGLTRADFDAAMPNEFWREVVDRVAQEAPNTLLLAEAFWMLEGYFVRTLGMHRVYNSAFMNMLKNEENAKYRSVIKKTLEFNPEILKRFVNFMNNPDEDTAVAQFGRDDKYFGVCILMCTMPGLPMFGHGQIEGLTEKYGMEYRRAYLDEQPDPWLIRRHELEVFPLLRKRYLFAEVCEYHLYDVVSPDGHVLEDVYAQSNRAGDERALVVMHNRWADVRGFIKTSVLSRKMLGQALGLSAGENLYIVFCDRITGLEYMRHSDEFFYRGLYVELGAFKYHVFMDFREVCDTDGTLHTLHQMLNGMGVAGMDAAMKEMALGTILNPFKSLMQQDLTSPQISEHIIPHLDRFLHGVNQHIQPSQALFEIREQIDAHLKHLFFLMDEMDRKKNTKPRAAVFRALCQSVLTEPRLRQLLYAWCIIHPVGSLLVSDNPESQSRTWIDEWMLGKVLENIWGDNAWECIMLLKIATQCTPVAAEALLNESPYALFKTLFAEVDVQALLNIHQYGEHLWFRQEPFDTLLSVLIVAVALSIGIGATRKKTDAMYGALDNQIRNIQAAVVASNFQVELLFEALRNSM